MSSPVVNTKTLTAFLTHEIDSDETFFTVLLQNFETSLKEFDSAQFTGEKVNLIKLAATGHKLKSSSRSFGAEQLATTVEKMEHAAKSGDSKKTEIEFLKAKKILRPTLEFLRSFSKQFFSKGKKSA